MQKSPDKKKVIQYSALQVGQDLNIIEQNQTRPTHYRFKTGKSYYLNFYPDGSYNDFKHGTGGDCIALVQQSLHPNRELDNRYFREALILIASHYGLWEHFEDQIDHAKKMASEQGEDHLRYMRYCLDAVNPQKKSQLLDSEKEAKAFFKILGLSLDKITFSAQPSPLNACLCWQPAIPWQGEKVHTKEEDGKKTWGGWTKEKAFSFVREENSLKFLVLELDGGSHAPLIAEQIKILKSFKEQGIHCIAHVVTGWYGNGVRAKSHFYFKNKHKAKNLRQWEHWHSFISRKWEEEAQKLKIDKEEKNNFILDPCTDQFTRLVRVPGFAKFGNIFAASLLSSDPTQNDFQNLVETEDRIFELPDNITIKTGKELSITRLVSKDGNESFKKEIGAFDVYPVSVYSDIHNSNNGVKFLYKNKQGEFHYSFFDSKAFSGQKKGQEQSSKSLEEGVQVYVNNGGIFSTILGFWAQREQKAIENIASKSGWYKKSFVNGETVLGENPIVPHSNAQKIEKRSQRRGDLKDWQGEAKKLITTPGLTLALGVSLAGPLLTPLKKDTFAIHVWGASSSGKSCASYIASSIWGSRKSIFNKWSATENFILEQAEVMNDACLILDEIQLYKAKPEVFEQFIYSMASGIGRGRCNLDGSQKERNEFKSTVLSTGEVSGEVKLGDWYKGGTSVRFIDIEISEGECTTSKNHAESIESWTQDFFGTVSDHWIDYLVQNYDKIKETFEFWTGKQLEKGIEGSEEGRIFSNLCVIITALDLASQSKIFPLSKKELDAIFSWIVERVYIGRTEKENPYERAYSSLQDIILEQPHRFPFHDHTHNGKDVIGFKVEQDIWIPISNLKRSGFVEKAGISVQILSEWIEKQGLGEIVSRKQVGGVRKRAWLKIPNTDFPF